MRTEKLLPLLRDLVCLGLGSFGFVWQVTHGADVVLMSGCILVLCGPTAMAAWALRGSTPDSGSSQPSAVAVPSSPPSPPSSSPAGADPV